MRKKTPEPRSPCPFCGHLDCTIARWTATATGTVYWVVCLQCGAAGPFATTRKKAVVVWGIRIVENR